MTESGRAAGGSLVVVGTGIRMIGQLTTESIAWMKHADRLLFVAADRLTSEALHQMNPGRAESLETFYVEGRPRDAIYRAMVDRILDCVRSGMLTCVASYGHPGVFGEPFHEAVRRARGEGYPARMLAAISAEDCLFADLGVDPATHGCQSYDATDFLMHRRTIDPSAAAILWQICRVGDPLARGGEPEPWALPMLVERLLGFHPPDHVCIIYRAAVFPGQEPEITASTIAGLARSALPTMSTLYIPPSAAPSPDPIVVDRIRAAIVGAGPSHPGEGGERTRPASR
jgi:Tetrapyrrole (Corrin/Porphyrin) Methylases